MIIRYSALLPILLALSSAPVMASFSIHSAPKNDHLGSFSPKQEEGHGAFRHSDAGNVPRQARYEQAELVLDLAYTPVSHRGNGVATQAEGFADDVPFASGMSMIIPRGWHLYRDKDLNNREVPQRISFDGGRDWPEVLRDLGQRHTLHFHIDWYDHTVMMSKGRPLPDMPSGRLRVIAEPEPTKAELARTDSKSADSASATGAASTGSDVDSTAGTAVGDGAAVASAVADGTVATDDKSVASLPTPPPAPTWHVQVSDQTYREAIARWAGTSGWTFEPEHWTVPVDIPLTAAATFRGDFKSAVQSLVSTTELSETPLQPCFYSNQVVRIVPYNEMCDRALAR